MNRDDGKTAGSLKKAVRDVRLALAERGDVVVDMREAEHARLALVAEKLADALADLPPDQEQFSLAVLPGDPPRLWVDATSFMMMARDKRTYQFVKDTRLGRTIMAESTSQDVMVEEVTRYVAERVVERERAVEADWLTALLRKRSRDGSSGPAGWEARAAAWGLIGFVLGAISGMFLLLAYAWVMVD